MPSGESISYFRLLTSSLYYLYCLALSLFIPQKRETEKAPTTASGSVATDFLPFVLSLTKNDKLPIGQTVSFF